jgi:hypothetical protein
MSHRLIQPSSRVYGKITWSRRQLTFEHGVDIAIRRSLSSYQYLTHMLVALARCECIIVTLVPYSCTLAHACVVYTHTLQSTHRFVRFYVPLKCGIFASAFTQCGMSLKCHICVVQVELFVITIINKE